MEHQVRTNEFKNRFELGDDTDTDLSLHSNMRARQLAAEIELSRRTMASLETLAGPEILEAQMEIARLITAEWRRAELAKLKARTPGRSSRTDRPSQHVRDCPAFWHTSQWRK